MSRAGIAVSKEDVVQPIGDLKHQHQSLRWMNRALGVHQGANCMENRLEIVLLWIAAHEDIERVVHL